MPRTSACSRRCGAGAWIGGDHQLDVAVLGIEPAEEIKHLARFRDGLSNVAELVGNALEGGAVLVNAGVALRDGVQLGLEVDGAGHLVVAEEPLDVAQEDERGETRLVDDVEDALVDGGVDPVDDCLVDLPPFGVALSDGRCRADEVIEAEFPEDRLKEASPLRIVRRP